MDVWKCRDPLKNVLAVQYSSRELASDSASRGLWASTSITEESWIPRFLQSPLSWALEPECGILMFMWSLLLWSGKRQASPGIGTETGIF